MTQLVPFTSRRGDLMNRRYAPLSNMIDDFFNDTYSNRLRTSNFKIDIKEEDNQYVIEAEIPGFDREQITLDLENGLLSITAEKTETTNDEKHNYIHRERTTRSMTRRIALGDVDEDQLKAKLDNGILEIIVPKKPVLEAKKRITIE